MHVYVPYHPNLWIQDSKSLELNGFDLLGLEKKHQKTNKLRKQNALCEV